MGHSVLPTSGPTVAIFEAANDSGLREFFPLDAAMSAPISDGEVALIGPIVAGFFVAPEVPKSGDLPELFERSHRFTLQGEEGRTARGEVFLKILEALHRKLAMAGSEVFGLEPRGFFDPHGQDATGLGGGKEGRVILAP